MSQQKLIRAAVALSGLLVSTTAFAQTASTTITTTPGVPTTAVGSNWLTDTLILLAGILLVFLGTVLFQARKTHE